MPLAPRLALLKTLMRFTDCEGWHLQEEGYEAALECNGMTLDQTQIKVEPCISAGPKAKRKGAGSGLAAANGGQQRDSAPKACFFTFDNGPQVADGILRPSVGGHCFSASGCCRSDQHLKAMPEKGWSHTRSVVSTPDLKPLDQMLRVQ